MDMGRCVRASVRECIDDHMGELYFERLGVTLNLTGGFHFVKLGLDLVSGALMRGRFVASPATKGEYHEVHAQGRIAS